MMAETSAVEKAVLKAELTAAQSVAGMAVRMVDWSASTRAVQKAVRSVLRRAEK
jgi:hypothetical protein